MKKMTRIFLILGLGTKEHTNLYFDARFCRSFYVKHSTIVKCGVQVITHVWRSHFCSLNLDDAVRVYCYTEVHWRANYKIMKQFVGSKVKGETSKRVLQGRERVGGAVRNGRLSENLACFLFLKHPFWHLPFCPITE